MLNSLHMTWRILSLVFGLRCVRCPKIFCMWVYVTERVACVHNIQCVAAVWWRFVLSFLFTHCILMHCPFPVETMHFGKLPWYTVQTRKKKMNRTKPKKKKTKDENNQSVCSSVCRSNSIGWVLISIIVVVVSVSVHANATHFNYSLQICVALCVVWCYWWHDVHAARSLQQNCHTDERIEQQKYNCGTWHNTIVYTSNRLTWKQKRQSNPMLVVELSQKRSPEHQQKREDFHLGPSRPPGNFWGTCPSRSQGLIKPIYRSPARNTPFSHLPAMCVRLYVCVCKHWSAHATKCLAIGHPIIIFLKMHWN